MTRKGKARNNKTKKAIALAEGRKLETSNAPQYTKAGQRITKYAAGGKCLPLLNRTVLKNVPGYDGVPGSTIVLLFRHPTDPEGGRIPTHVQYWQGRDDHEVLLQPLHTRESPVECDTDLTPLLFVLEEVELSEKERNIFGLMDPSVRHEIFKHGKDFGTEEFGLPEGLIEKIYNSYSSHMENGYLDSAVESGMKLAREIVEAEAAARKMPVLSLAYQRHLQRLSMPIMELKAVTAVQYAILSQSTREEELSSARLATNPLQGLL